LSYGNRPIEITADYLNLAPVQHAQRGSEHRRNAQCSQLRICCPQLTFTRHSRGSDATDTPDTLAHAQQLQCSVQRVANRGRGRQRAVRPPCARSHRIKRTSSRDTKPLADQGTQRAGTAAEARAIVPGASRSPRSDTKSRCCKPTKLTTNHPTDHVEGSQSMMRQAGQSSRPASESREELSSGTT